MQSIDWTAVSARDGGLPNVYIETLVKEHTTLHKVLSRLLHAATVDYIISQVFAALDARFQEEFAAIEVMTEVSRQRMLVDVRWMRRKLEDLGGVNSVAAPGLVSGPISSAAIL